MAGRQYVSSIRQLQPDTKGAAGRIDDFVHQRNRRLMTTTDRSSRLDSRRNPLSDLAVVRDRKNDFNV